MISENHTGNILVIGALGQIGSELTTELRNIYGSDRVIGADIRKPVDEEGRFAILDVLDKKAMAGFVETHQIEVVFQLAAILSAKGEQQPQLAWEINMNGLLNLLEIARDSQIKRIFWPSSIAVFGPTSPRIDTPQDCIMDPTTVYGISKLAGERWCAYYAKKYGIDVRSLRYPGLIGYKSMPGGGTTDYAVDIFHAATKNEPFTSFLGSDTRLPMMYMPDAIRATIQLMQAPSDSIKVRSSYNLGGISFTPAEITQAIQQHIPDFTTHYAPDFRQEIANSWPESMNDSIAREQWGWEPEYNLARMTEDMLSNVRLFYPETVV
ncbi:UNVERIFIED_CONTAM: hypothetical protein GTU68_008312 [Idotea baltica]|nr:hypothetical protein [Idotea baltica]